MRLLGEGRRRVPSPPIQAASVNRGGPEEPMAYDVLTKGGRVIAPPPRPTGPLTSQSKADASRK